MMELQLWQKISIYLLILLSLFIYVKVSNLKINGLPLLRKKYSIALATFFPLVLVIAVVLGSIILAIALAGASLIALYSFFTKKRINITITKRIQNKPPLS